MKISIITVCFNAAETIERTINSVLSQSYPDIEYIVVDGASTDGTVEIVKKYKTRINRFISEKDNGIYDAMNKGLALSTGGVINYLNADDYYYDNDVLIDIAKAFEVDSSRVFVYGKAELTDAPDHVKFNYRYSVKSINDFRDSTICHQTVFARRELFVHIGGFNCRYKYAADVEWLIKAFKHQPSGIYELDRIIVYFSLTGCSYQYAKISRKEIFEIRVRHLFSLANLLYYFRYIVLRGIKKKILNEEW